MSVAHGCSQLLSMRLPLALLLLCLCLWTCLVAGACIEAPGSPVCGGHGDCLNVSVSSSSGTVWRERCLCAPMRFESSGEPSETVSEPFCSQGLHGAAPSFLAGGVPVLAVLLALIGAVVIVPLIKLCCFTRPAPRDTRFERITVVSHDLLKPTNGQLKHARLTLTIVAVAVVLWIVDAFDPFGADGSLNDAGGFRLTVSADGDSAEASGMVLRDLLDDIAEWCLFACYVLFFIPFRRVVAPAPALLSGAQYMRDWARAELKVEKRHGGVGKEEKDKAKAKAAEEKEVAEERAAEARDLAAVEAPGDFDRRWREAEAAALTRFKEELAETDAEMAQREVQRMQQQQQQGVSSTLPSLSPLPPPPPPPPPPRPPLVPAPPSPRAGAFGKSADKYAVSGTGSGAAQPTRSPPSAVERGTLRRLSQQRVPAADNVDWDQMPAGAEPKPRPLPLQSSPQLKYQQSSHLTSLPHVPQKTSTTAGDSSSSSSDDEDAGGVRSPSASSHAIRIDKSAAQAIAAAEAAYARTIAETESVLRKNEADAARLVADADSTVMEVARATAALPSDASVTVNPADILAFPVPSYLSCTFALHAFLAFLLVILLAVAHATGQRILYSAGMFACYALVHLVHSVWMLGFWDPLYLISLREDILRESGVRLPSHRTVVASAGSAATQSTSTLHFGIQTAYELSKLHSLYLRLMIYSIIGALAQQCLALYVSWASAPISGRYLPADEAVLYFLALRMLQAVRVASIFTTVFPWQPIIQYIQLANFWLDGKLQWGDAVPDEARSRNDDRVRQLAPQLARDEFDEEEFMRQASMRQQAILAVPQKQRASAAQIAALELEAESLRLAQEATDKALDDRGCLPLYIATSFRPIPTPDEVAAVRQDAAKPALLEELKAARAADREQLKAAGGMLAGSTRLWRAGRLHQKLFFEEPDPQLFRRKKDGQSLEKRIAHAQFLIWREQQLAPFSDADQRALRGEKPLPGEGEDGFQPMQALYGDADSVLALAKARRMAHLQRAQSSLQDAEEAQVELQRIERERDALSAKLAASNAKHARNASANALPPLKIKRHAAAVAPPLPGQGVRKKALPTRMPDASSTTAPVAAPSPLLPDGSGGGATLAPAELQGVVNEPDDFEESRSLAIDDQASPRNMFLATPRDA